MTAWSWWGSGCSDSYRSNSRGQPAASYSAPIPIPGGAPPRPTSGVGRTDPRGLVELVREVTGGRGADATLITASALSSDVMIAAPEITRLRGRVVVVGFVGMDFPQKPFYEKELDIVFSMSYGPGRYDGEYEEKGRDYPFSLVRWTEGRNMAAFLRMVEEGAVRPGPMTTHRVPLDNALETYAALLDDKLGAHLGVVIEYAGSAAVRRPGSASAGRAAASSAPSPSRGVRVGLIGAGAFATGTLIPALQQAGDVAITSVSSASGRSAAATAVRLGARAVSEAAQVIEADDVDLVMILTRHDSHAGLVCDALAAGKHVFVEKPLALTLNDVTRVEAAARASGRILMVGHNRRFSPLLIEALGHLGAPLPKPAQVVVRINAGPMEPDHWHRDPEVGGGRWLAEGSHFVDLAAAVLGEAPQSVAALSTAGDPALPYGDSWQVSLGFGSGSTAVVLYTDLGDRALEKEYVEIFAGGSCAVLHDFSRLEVLGAVDEKSSAAARTRGTGTRWPRSSVRFAKVVAPRSSSRPPRGHTRNSLAPLAMAHGCTMRVDECRPTNPGFRLPERASTE